MPDIITRALLESKGIPTRDIVAAIWGRKLSGGYEPAEATGTLPLTFRSNGTALIDYRIYGNTLTTKLNLWEWGNANYRIDLTTPIAANTTLTYAVFKEGIANNAEGIYLYDVNGSRILNAACANTDGSRIYATVTPTRDVHRIELSPMAADALRMLTEGDTPPDEYISPEITEVQGVGVRTENLFDKNLVTPDSFFRANGAIGSTPLFDISDFIPVENGNYLIYRARSAYTGSYHCVYDENKNFVRSIIANIPNTSITIGDSEKYIRISINKNREDECMVVKGSTAPDQYIPYGYRMPMVSRTENAPYHRTDTPIYIGNAQLMQDEYVSYSEQKIYKKVNGTLMPQDPPAPLPELPTFSDAETVLDYEETPAPEEAWVKYHKK